MITIMVDNGGGGDNNVTTHILLLKNNAVYTVTREYFFSICIL